MGYAERFNENSKWNKKRTMNMSSEVASPILNSPTVSKVSTPAPVKRDEPMVIEITPKSVFLLFKDFLCRTLNRLNPNQSRSLAPTS